MTWLVHYDKSVQKHPFWFKRADVHTKLEAQNNISKLH